MRKIYCWLLVFVLLFGQVSVFGVASSVVDTDEWIKAQGVDLTEGSQKEIVEKVTGHIDAAMIQVAGDVNGKATLTELNKLMISAVAGLDYLQATELVEHYGLLIQAYYDHGKLKQQEIQWASDIFTDFVGKYIIGIEGVNQGQIKYILGQVVGKNVDIQGVLNVSGKRALTLAELDKQMTFVEKTHRITTNRLNGYNSLKEVSRGVSKALILQSNDDQLDLVVGSDIVKKMVASKLNFKIDHKGIVYDVPTTMLEHHTGDFKVKVSPVAIDTLDSYGTIVSDGAVTPLLAYNVEIGKKSKASVISVQVPVNQIKSDEVGCFALLTEKNGIWQKQLSKQVNNQLCAKISSTGLLIGAEYNSTFTDLPSHWAKDRINKLLAAGIASKEGSTQYGPDDKMTRGEFVRMLVNVIGTENKSENTFTDIPEGSAYADIIESAIYGGFTVGVEGKEFKAETVLTREDVVTLVANMYEVENGYALTPGFIKFKDMPDIAPYARDAVKGMKEAGFVSGYDDNTFRPKDTVTRAEAIAVLYNALGY